MPRKQNKTQRKGAKFGPPSVASQSTNSFADFLKPLVPPPGRPIAKATLLNAPLAHLDYDTELKLKDEGLRLFWQHFKLPGRPEHVIASPKPRGYRTTSKRKAVLRGSTFHLVFGDKTSSSQKQPFLESPLEPRGHARIYKFLQQKLSEPAYRLVAGHLNYIIIRGNYTARAVIFNVDTLNGPLVRKLKMLAGHLQKLPELVAAAFIYPDPSGSDYYLESRRPADLLHFKKLFGPGQLEVRHEKFRYRFHPTSFSQVNESMVGTMLDRARELLPADPEGCLLDLYCGYGLFSHYLSPNFKQVLGIDAEGPSIRAAIANSRLNKNTGHAKFLARRITAGVIDDDVPASLPINTALLDPPRQGPEKGVIAAVSRRRPQRVLHVFCSVDQIPASLKEWQANGYQVRRILPLDMFPGTTNLEIMILLTPKH